jgi:hypothetical protein
MKCLLGTLLVFCLSVDASAGEFVLALNGEETACRKAFSATTDISKKHPDTLLFKVTADQYETDFQMQMVELKGRPAFKNSILNAYRTTIDLFNQEHDTMLADDAGGAPHTPPTQEFMVLHRSEGRNLYLSLYHGTNPEEGVPVEAKFISGSWEDLLANRPVIFKLTEDGLVQWHTYVNELQKISVTTTVETLALPFEDLISDVASKQTVETVVEEQVVFEGNREKLDMVSSDRTKWSAELKFKK